MVTRSGDVPSDIPMFSEAEARIVVFSAEDHDFSSCHADVQLVRLDPGELTLTTVMRRLRTDFEIRLLLCEGGPTVFGSLLQEGLVDELFLTLAPQLAGRDEGSPRLALLEGAALWPDSPRWLGLRSVRRAGDHLFLRYVAEEARP
jgi:5-amino-6-(5-phosphoribosylamino)uracil reductase